MQPPPLRAQVAERAARVTRRWLVARERGGKFASLGTVHGTCWSAGRERS